MPYLYTLTYENATTGVPMMRPLFYVDDTPALLDHKDTYLWGDAFLVSPVTEKGVSYQSVYLPKNSVWFNYFSGERYEGGQTIDVPVDINTIPVFVKAGSLIPTVPVFKSMDEYTSEKMTLHYYHDASVKAATGQMYEDDGETKDAILKQQYELLSFSSAFDSEALNITIDVQGFVYKGRPQSRGIELQVHQLNKKPGVVMVNNKLVKVSSTKKKPGRAYFDKSIQTLMLTLSEVNKHVQVKIQ